MISRSKPLVFSSVISLCLGLNLNGGGLCARAREEERGITSQRPYLKHRFGVDELVLDGEVLALEMVIVGGPLAAELERARSRRESGFRRLLRARLSIMLA